MDKNKKTKTSNIPKGDTLVKKKKKYTKLIPFHIPNANQAYLLPDQYKKNIVLINDLETLNDSSSYNYGDCLTNKDQLSLADSISLIHSRQGSKTSLFEEKNKINNQKIQEDLIKKEKENILLRNEIIDLKKDLHLIKDKESSYEYKIIKMNENYKNLEKVLSSLKKEYSLKEKDYLEKIEQLKNEIKNKNIILNSLHEKIIYKNQLIQNLNNLIRVKDSLITESNNKIKKIHKYKRNSININQNINHNKENENFNDIQNIINNVNQERKKNTKLKKFLKKNKINYVDNSKIKKVISNIEDRNISQIYYQSKPHHSSTYRNQGPSNQINNYNYLEESKIKIPKKTLKDISLKKQLNVNKKILKIKSKKKETNRIYTNNSMRNISNLKLDKNNTRQLSRMSYNSNNGKITENIIDNKRIEKINNLRKNNILIKEGTKKEVFLRRLYKNNKKNLKTSINDSTNSYYCISDSENNKNNLLKITTSNSKNDIKSSDIFLNDFGRKNNNAKKEYFDIISEKIFRSINHKNKIPNKTRKINSYQATDNNDHFNNNHSFFNDNQSTINGKRTYIPGQYRYKRSSINYTNSIFDGNVNLSNNRNNFDVNSFKIK